ncbi:MAG: acylphosphatase [Chloroflexota bacterium]
MQRMHLRIHGRVQGVSFRFHARERAQSLGLTGWIRNLPDGSVEADVQGPADAVSGFVRWAQRGPSGASVEHVDTDTREPDETTRSFRIVSASTSVD